MPTTAHQLLEYVRSSIRTLSLDPRFGSLESVYRDLSERSGVSKSAVMKLYSGELKNPTVNTLDSLVKAVRGLMRKSAA